MIDVKDEIKQAYDLNTTQVDKIILNNQEYKITNVEYYDDVYNDGNIFGTAIGKCLEFEIGNDVDLERQEVEYQTGIIINGVAQWISLGSFIIQDIVPNDTTNKTKVAATDYMLKTNILYQSNLNYGDGTVTLLDVLQEVCSNSGITLATMEFTNSTFIVDSNQFADGTLNRQVIQAVAQMSGTIAKIKNNQLHLIGPSTTISKVFTLNNYEEAEIKRATHPINLVSLGITDVEGENVVLRDEASIATNGENSLIINDNPFAYTQAKREQLITALFDAVKGFEYKAFSFKCQGLPYLETMDKVQFLDKEGNNYDSYVFRFNYKSPNGLESTIEAPSIIKATVAYKNVLNALEISKRTEILVDKQNQKIQSVVSQTDAQNQKISVVEQTVNELNSKISDIADITTSKESTNGTVSFEKINQSEPIYVRIYPTGENISYLYPHANLFPSGNLYLKVRTLRFTNTTTNEYFDYELPTDLLYYDAQNYDEFILDYDAQKCEVNKRVGYNADGTTYVLDAVQTIEYDFPKIELTDGDYTIELLGYHNAYLFVRLMAQNIYTTQFATKAELNSEISQTTSEINLSVDKKLTSYPTTTQMNSAISVKANEITSSVNQKLEGYDTSEEVSSKIQQSASSITSTVANTYVTKNNANSTYATKTELTTAKSEIKQTTDSISSTVSKKVGKDEIISKINQSAEAVQINANKISLNGKTINLTSDNTTIKSTNFNVDKNGNATMSNADITGGTIKLSGGVGNPKVIVRLDTNANVKTQMDCSSFEVYSEQDTENPVASMGKASSGNNTFGIITLIGTGDYNETKIYNGSANFWLGDSHTYVGGNQITTDGNIYASNISSDIRLKENIKKSKIDALGIINKIEIKSFDWKKDKKHIDAGFVAQEVEKIDENFVLKREIKDKQGQITDYQYYINELPIIATILKAVQEQQELIKQLQNEINELKKERE